MTTALITISSIALGLVAGILFFRNKRFLNLERDMQKAQEQIESSKQEAEAIRKQLEEYVQKRKEIIAQETRRREERINKLEELLNTKEELSKKRAEKNKEIELLIATQQEEIQGLSEGLKRKTAQVVQELTKKTNTSSDEMKKDLINKYTSELENENTEKIIKEEEWAKENAEKNAKKIIINSLQRLCSPTSVETRVITIDVPRDHVKGKIVGQGGQNILHLESLLNVDIVFNDLPNTISVSAFNLVERRIAQKTIEKLVKAKSEINKETIDRAFKDATEETDKELYEIGKNAVEKMGLKNKDKEFLRIVGRLQYRTSYGQNIMKHSMEVGWVAAILGNEIGLDPEVCKVAGFLHDLGKAIDQDPNVKDAHDHLTKELMEKFGFSWEEVHAAWTHHDAIPQETPEALIVKAADAISASRPGARQESMDRYIERIRALEAAATSIEGVKSAFAISAGREVRVMVDPEKINDSGTQTIAKNLAKTIEENLAYPGKIKVNVIRRTKHTEVAK